MDLQDYASFRKFVSCWYRFCQKCREKELGPGWEPAYWHVFCPYPYFPTYRHVARVMALLLLILASWGVTYAIMGRESAPGGQFFQLACVSIVARIGGWMCQLIALHSLVGELIVGILFENFGLINLHGVYHSAVSILRKIGLVIILTRAGLDLDPDVMRKMWLPVIMTGLLPWLAECACMMLLTHFFIDLPWMWALFLGAIYGAASPAVVVPCLYRLRDRGYGVAKGIPTLIIAMDVIGDVASMTAFGMIRGIMFSNNSVVFELSMGPISIVAGVVFGIVWGFIASYIPEKFDPFVGPLRIMILLSGGLTSVLGSELIHLGGAGPLACIIFPFLAIYSWTKMGWDVEENPVATAFEVFWMIGEPILFGLTGTQIKLSEMERDTTLITLAIIIICGITRLLVTVLVSVRATLNMKEKVFIGLALMSKGSMQAALGPVAREILWEKDDESQRYASLMDFVCVFSILVTCPICAVVISLSGSRLLTKTSKSKKSDTWRRTARASLRDIGISDLNVPFWSHRQSVVDTAGKYRPKQDVEKPDKESKNTPVVKKEDKINLDSEIEPLISDKDRKKVRFMGEGEPSIPDKDNKKEDLKAKDESTDTNNKKEDLKAKDESTDTNEITSAVVDERLEEEKKRLF